jgi:hypothetical protein
MEPQERPGDDAPNELEKLRDLVKFYEQQEQAGLCERVRNAAVKLKKDIQQARM